MDSAKSESKCAEDAPANSAQGKKMVLLAVLAAIIVAFAFQGSRGLYESTEGRYAECARQSMEQGSLDEPLLNGHHHWTKPPFVYYATAAGYRILGVNTWGARFGLAVAFSVTVVAVYFLSLQVWGGAAAPYCTLVYGLSPFTQMAAGNLSTDTYLQLWVVLAMLFFWKALRSGRGWWMVLMWVAMGMGFLTKGPLALIPLVPAVITHVHLRRRGEHPPHVLNPLGVLVFLVTGLSWYAAKAFIHQDLLRYWFFDEIVGRNLYGEFNRNPEFYKPLVVYGPVLLFGLVPWTVFILLRRKHIPWPSGKWRKITQWDHPAEWLYVVSAVLIPLVIFCLSASRLPLYMLPLFAPLALAVGVGLSHLVGKGALGAGTLRNTAVVVFVLLLAVKMAAAYVPSENNMAFLERDLRPHVKQHPDADYYVLKQDNPLYGLQFYMDGKIVAPVHLADTQEVLKTARTGRTQLVLVRHKTLDKIKDQMDSRVYRVENLNKKWGLIVIQPQQQETGRES